MNRIKVILVMGLIITLLGSCKKESITQAVKDNAASIKNKNWWGVLTYTGETSQYYTVHFNGDNTLIWSQLSGDYAGQWSINGKTLAITVTGINAKIQAEISNADDLINITDNSAAYEINNGKLLPDANVNLEKTIWKGSGLSGGGTSGAVQLSFMINLIAEIKLSNTAYPPYPYETSASGKAFRIHTPGGYQYFGVIVSTNEIKGSAHLTQFPFQLNKQ